MLGWIGGCARIVANIQFFLSSHESGFSTAHCLDSDDTSSCLDLEDEINTGRGAEEDEEADAMSVYSVRSSQSLATNGRASRTSRSKRKTNRKNLLVRSQRFGVPMNSTENYGRGDRALESSLPFTDPAALDKIKYLENQLEQLKLTISQIIIQNSTKPPPTPPSSPTSNRRVVPPPPPPPLPPSAPPPPPPPLPSTPLGSGTPSIAGRAAPTLQEMLASKQGNLTKAAVDHNTPKDQPDCWSSVISAIKGGGAKLKKVER